MRSTKEENFISKIQKEDYYKKLLENICKINNISLKPRFERIEDIVVINIKNTLKEGVDLDCVMIINLIYQTLKPFNIKYTQNLLLYPNRKRLDRIEIILNKNDYILLNEKIEKGDIS